MYKTYVDPDVKTADFVVRVTDQDGFPVKLDSAWVDATGGICVRVREN